MRKNNLTKGGIYISAGIVFLILSFCKDSKAGSIFFGLAVAGIIAGIVMVYKNWNKPV